MSSEAHQTPPRSRCREINCGKWLGDCKDAFVHQLALALAAGALIFSGAQMASLGEWRLGVAEMVVAVALTLWAAG